MFALAVVTGKLMVLVVLRSKTLTSSPNLPSLHRITRDMVEVTFQTADSTGGLSALDDAIVCNAPFHWWTPGLPGFL